MSTQKVLDADRSQRYYVRDGYMNEPLTPAVFHILLALSEGERHGYAIMQSVAEETGSAFTMGPGTLYGSIKRMIDSGLIEETGERSDPNMPGEGSAERRRYYRITPHGTQVAIGEAKRLEMLVRMARGKSLLTPKSLLAKAKGV
jgi:DNA-binding PadR family transcriptional regulator